VRTFTRETVLIASPHLQLQSGETTLLESPHATYRFTGRASELVRGILPLIEGHSSLGSIESTSGIPIAELSAVLGRILPEDLVDISPERYAKTPEQFMSLYFTVCDDWARYIFDSPFWNSMLNGRCSPMQVLGWGVEFYHRTLGADEHNETSVKHCDDPEVKDWLVEHFTEEFGHGDMFLRGLVASGLRAEDVLQSTALPTTRALIEYFDGLAARDTLAYLGCYGVLHSPRVGQTPERIREQFDKLVAHYPFAAGVLNAIREHALLDVDLKHDQIVLERLASAGRVFTGSAGSRIMNAAKGSVTAFSQYFDGMYQYYGGTEAALIRRSPQRALA
jgi:pyrroloquinoline quinone (PQQ) biosynthesis protein C